MTRHPPPRGHWKQDPTSRRVIPRPIGWGATRQAALQRDGHRCTWVTAGWRCTNPATDVDHIGDPDDHSLENLRSLCGPHHNSRTGTQAAGVRWAKLAEHRRAREARKHPGFTGDTA